MPFYSFATGGGGANQALDNTYDTQGLDADGAGTAVTADASVNVLGTPVAIYTAPADLSGFYVWVRATSVNPRYQFSVRAGATTYIVNDFYVTPGTTSGIQRVFFPLNVASGTVLYVAQRSSTASAVLHVAITGEHRNSQSPPRWTSLETIHVDTSNTRAGSVTVTADDGWDPLIDPTAQAYGGLMYSVGVTSTNPAGTPIAVSIGIGAAASEAAIFEQPFILNTASPQSPAGNGALIEKIIPVSSRLSGRIKSATNTDTAYIALYGLVA